MKVGIISDTHGDAASWRQVMEKVFSGVDLIVHAGDILYHGPRNPLVEGYNPPELAGLINSSPVPVLFARGNCDAEVDQLLLDYPIQSPYAFLQLGHLRIMAHHGDGLDREAMLSLAKRYRARIFISGHTHVPVLDGLGEAVLVNPGSPSLPKGEGRPTVAVLECGENSFRAGEGSFLVRIFHVDDGTDGDALSIGWKTHKLSPEKE